MPITFKIDHAKRHVEALAEGGVTLKDIEEFLDALVVQGAIPYRKLFDGRRSVAKYVDLDAELMSLAARISAYSSHLERRGPLAIVAGDLQSQELAARFLNLGKPAGRPGRAFLDDGKARRWLEEQPET